MTLPQTIGFVCYSGIPPASTGQSNSLRNCSLVRQGLKKASEGSFWAPPLALACLFKDRRDEPKDLEKRLTHTTPKSAPRVDQVETLRLGPLGAELQIPEPFDPGNDEHLEQIASQLLQRFRQHDDVEAFVALIELTQGRLLQIAEGVSRRLALVIIPDELVATFMSRLFTDVRKPYPGGPVRRFLKVAYTMMRFDALNQLRSLRRAQKRDTHFEQLESTRRQSLNPSQVAEVRESEIKLAHLATLLLALAGRCFHELKIRDRRILICREIEGLSYDEISAAMGLRRSQVGMILKRARIRLITRIDRALPESFSPGAPGDTSLKKAKPTSRRKTHTGSGKASSTTHTNTNLELV